MLYKNAEKFFPRSYSAGVGKTRKTVEYFLGSRVYTIPYESVRKGLNTYGLIVNDNSYGLVNSISISSVPLENSVTYISFWDRVLALSRVS